MQILEAALGMRASIKFAQPSGLTSLFQKKEEAMSVGKPFTFNF